LDQLKLNLEDKVEQMTMAIRNEETNALAVDDEIKRLLDYKTRMLNRAETIKKHIKLSMEQNGIKSLKFNNFSLTVAKTAGRVVIENEALIPKKYWIEKKIHTIDKMKIKEDLKNRNITGAKLFSGTSLRIK
jgi:hypothetical protein